MLSVDDPTMKGALIASGLFHVFIFVLSIVGLPFIVKDAPIIMTPVSIELVDISDMSQTNKRAAPQEKEKPVELEKPEPPPQNMAPQMTAEKPPEIAELEKPKDKPEPSEPTPPEPIQEVAEKEDPAPKPKPKPKEKPKPKVEEQKSFDSLLKNLAPDAGETKNKEETENVEDTANGQIARLSDQLSISELDAFKYQLQPCWNIPAGAKYAENLAVEIRVIMNRDMTMKSATILDQGRYSRDSAYKAAADSAMRALRNPRCSPFKLPPEKYDQWKSIVINFNPQDML